MLSWCWCSWRCWLVKLVLVFVEVLVDDIGSCVSPSVLHSSWQMVMAGLMYVCGVAGV